DGTRSIGAHCQRYNTASYRGSGAGTRTTGNTCFVVRIRYDPKGRRIASDPEGKFVGVGLPHNIGPSSLELFDDLCVFAWHMIGKEPRTHGRSHTGGSNNVFNSDRDAL